MSDTLFLSFDVKADGDSPTVNNMLSIGIVGFDSTGTFTEEFQRNIRPHPSKQPDTRCMREFWENYPEAHAFVQQDMVSAETAMTDLAKWFSPLLTKYKKIRWMKQPTAYKWKLLNEYYTEFGPQDKPNTGFKDTCIWTIFTVSALFHTFVAFAAANRLTQEEEYEAWERMTKGQTVTHNPLDDAKFQAQLYINLFKEMKMRFV